MHVAIIMDGNGRWATQRDLPRTAGHIEGAKAVRATVEAAARAGVDTLTLYAFSAANWSRPAAEIAALMKLFGQYLFSETRRCVEQSIRVNVIGRRDRLSENLLRSIEQSERLSASCTGMNLRVAVDYSSQYSILKAAQSAARQCAGNAEISSDDFERALHDADHSARAAGPVDLLIRTGNERRLSDFMLWECAFAELYFCDCLWPEFDEARFRRALSDYAGRQRRFGGLTAKAGDPG
ncbi:MAG: undecaprenyl diphosphate synthase [Gammaproteobacteria bacterium]|nr:undecaprenyl diphosphate synthase [Gammaproteobacteria bacterium]